MAILILILLINGQIFIEKIQLPTTESCENAKTEYTLAYTPNSKDGYEMYKNADVSIVSMVCTNLSTGAVF